MNALRAAGVGYVPMPAVRSEVTRRLGPAGFGLGRAVNALLHEHQDCERLILSDENILGGLRPSRLTGSFYSGVRSRLGRLKRKLGRNDVKIFLAIRSYDEFISAMYCEYIRHNSFTSSDSYLANVDFQSLSWTRLIADLVKIAGDENVVCWSFEDFPAIEDKVFGALTGGLAHLVERPEEKLRESLSADAVDLLGKLPRGMTRKDIRSRSKRIGSALPKGPTRPAFSAFEARRAQALRARYDEEVSGLERLFPGITLLVPTALDGTTSLQSQ